MICQAQELEKKLPKAGLFTKLAFPWNCTAGPRTEVEIVKTIYVPIHLTLTQIWRVPKRTPATGSICDDPTVPPATIVWRRARGRRRLHNDSTRLYCSAVLYFRCLPVPSVSPLLGTATAGRLHTTYHYGNSLPCQPLSYWCPPTEESHELVIAFHCGGYILSGWKVGWNTTNTEDKDMNNCSNCE